MPYSSVFANDMLCSPYDEMATVSPIIKKNLTEEVFIRDCYCHPVFVEQDVPIPGVNSEGDPTLAEADRLNEINMCLNDYRNFQNWLYNFSDTSIYTISGNAGTGKTTLINYLRYTVHNNLDAKKLLIQKYQREHSRINEEKGWPFIEDEWVSFDLEWILLDVTRARRRISWFNTDAHTTPTNFRKPMIKTICVILQEINRRLSTQGGGDGTRVEKICRNLETLVSNYERVFAQEIPAGGDFFDNLRNALEQKGSDKDRVLRVATLCEQWFSGVSDSEGKKEIEALHNALNVLLLTLRCEKGADEKKFIIVYDNFERFVKGDEIYNKDINAIRLELAYFVEDINQSPVYCERVKFIMCIRSSTIRKCHPTLQPADVNPRDLCVEKWYNTDKILQKKARWYFKNNIHISHYGLVKRITSDLRVLKNAPNDGKVLTGLKLQIPPLFNYNKRLNIECIGMVVEDEANKRAVAKYQELWKEDSSNSRFAARSIIRGLVLRKLEEVDKLFMHLKLYSMQEHSQQRPHSMHEHDQLRPSSGSGDTRKILTILYNRQVENPNHETTVSEILRELYGPGINYDFWSMNDPLVRSIKRTFCEILFYMNSYNRRDNNWIQFIDLQFKERHVPYAREGTSNSALFQSSVLVDTWRDLEDLIGKYMDDLTVYLMPAGKAFLEYIVPSFEFFSVRYCGELPPLFAAIPTPEELEQDWSRELDCLKILRTVTEYAQKCLDNLTEEGNADIPLIGQNVQYHAERIINHHVNYINAFIQHVTDHYLDESSHLFKAHDSTYNQAYRRMKTEADKCRDVYLEYQSKVLRWKNEIK